ncbi:hypothetical protein CPB83DRAFT_854213 [Crepidotus variabilis]|uniref:F-box domain-containing protein n=1 Tax=Crepidotus variabilis TaxID=179855 RepID=A0A9P6EFA8_9AGAR|nr:hypothetical protein CPB83DRAFT_854213 [Crepidotus variabilis]
MSFNTIPFELIAEIFEQAAVVDFLAPVTLSHVCNGWRKVAISDPSLWTTICIETGQTKEITTCTFVETFLNRSKSLPISITLVDRRGSKLITNTINLLAQHSFRWTSLKLTHSGPNCLKTLLQPAPILRDVSITTSHLDDTGFYTISRFLELLPSMTTLSLNFKMQPAIRLSSIAPSCPHESLLDLTLKDWCPTPLLAMLGHCVRLQTLSIHGLDLHEPPPVYTDQNPRPINLPDLRKIYIYQYCLNDSICVLFDQLTCPNLRGLDISSGFVDYFPFPKTSVASFLRRSACPLTSVLFEMVQITEDQLLECLEACSKTLEYFDVIEQRDVFCVGDKLLNKLTAGTEHHDGAPTRCTTLCPRLRAFQVNDALDCQDGALAAFLRSRQPSNIHNLACDHCTPLDKASIRIRKKFRENLGSDIDYLKENGHWVM